jgi:two-component system, cell cycle sensor histidine kinase and response regulator CckA
MIRHRKHESQSGRAPCADSPCISDSSRVAKEADLAKIRILVVDDECQVLRLVASLLERAGYEVATASGPLQALQVVMTTNRTFDLVVSDVVMPEMRGPQLANEIRFLSPASGIIFMSGYVDPDELPKGTPFLRKPFSQSDLLGAVRGVLRVSARKHPHGVRVRAATGGPSGRPDCW